MSELYKNYIIIILIHNNLHLLGYILVLTFLLYKKMFLILKNIERGKGIEKILSN